MKSLFTILFSIPLLGFAQSVHDSHQLLWEVSGDGIKTSYIFGSMHTNDRRVYNLSDSTYIALDKAEMISCEVDLFSAFEDRDPLYGNVEVKYDSNGEPYTSSRESSRTAYGNEDGMPQPLDAYFQQYCLNAGKTFEPLETVEFQMNMLNDIDLTPNWRKLSIETVLNGEEELLKSYLAGDIYTMDEMMKRSLNIYPKLYDVMIIDRNKGMATKLDSLMKINSVFCAVGAGHLAGGSGLITLLRARGFEVRKVMATYAEEKTISEKNVKAYRDYTYENDSIGFNAIFPGKPSEVTSLFEDEEDLIHLIYRDLGQGNTYEIEAYERSNELTFEELAKVHIPSPLESDMELISLENGGEAYQGIGQTYWDGIHWIRVVCSEDILLVIKAYGGNKFMNSPRAFRFFDKVWIE